MTYQQASLNNLVQLSRRLWRQDAGSAEARYSALEACCAQLEARCAELRVSHAASQAQLGQSECENQALREGNAGLRAYIAMLEERLYNGPRNCADRQPFSRQ